jgi:hypothetical protein
MTIKDKASPYKVKYCDHFMVAKFTTISEEDKKMKLDIFLSKESRIYA